MTEARRKTLPDDDHCFPRLTILKEGMTMRSTCIACKGCTKRSVEPLCRNSCEAWQEHVEERNAVYKKNEKSINEFIGFFDTGNGKRFAKQINCWRRQGR